MLLGKRESATVLRYRIGSGVLLHSDIRRGFTKETWQMRPHGTLSLLMQDDTALKRINITPSPDTSIASLMGAAGPGVSAKR